jgi:hypothetical protein
MSNLTTWFDPESKRAKAGLAFQKQVLDELQAEGVKAMSVPEWLRRMDPELVNAQIWMLEKIWGDIVCKTKGGKSIFLECVTATSETTLFPMSKIWNFSGANKFYAFGWDNHRHFVPSPSWNSYVSKIEEKVQREADTAVVVPRRYLSNMRCGTSGIRKFCEENDLV